MTTFAGVGNTVSPTDDSAVGEGKYSSLLAWLLPDQAQSTIELGLGKLLSFSSAQEA